jgi:hypothetical protein
MGRDMYRGHVVSAGLSLPVFVSRGGGVADVLSVPLNLAEQQALKASADILNYPQSGLAGLLGIGPLVF